MKWWLSAVLCLSACATTHPAVPLAQAEDPGPRRETSSPHPVDVQARERVQGALAALPRCQPGAEVGHLVVRAASCTKMFCDQACCNQCSWAATYETMSGSREADLARVQAVLGLPERALDCEIAAWGQALAGRSLALDAPSCLVP